jgi:hypothetical protein
MEPLVANWAPRTGDIQVHVLIRRAIDVLWLSIDFDETRTP